MAETNGALPLVVSRVKRCPGGRLRVHRVILAGQSRGKPEDVTLWFFSERSLISRFMKAPDTNSLPWALAGKGIYVQSMHPF